MFFTAGVFGWWVRLLSTFLERGRFPGIVDALASLESDFVLDGELVALDSQRRPSFQLLQDSLSRELPSYFYAFDLLNRNGKLLVNCNFPGVASCWKIWLLQRPKNRCASRHYCERHRDRFLRRRANSVWKASWANGTIPLTNRASDQARGSSIAQTESRSSSLAVTSPARTGSMRCSWAFTRTTSSSLSRK